MSSMKLNNVFVITDKDGTKDIEWLGVRGERVPAPNFVSSVLS